MCLILFLICNVLPLEISTFPICFKVLISTSLFFYKSLGNLKAASVLKNKNSNFFPSSKEDWKFLQGSLEYIRKSDLNEVHTIHVGRTKMDPGTAHYSLAGLGIIPEANNEQKIQTWMFRANIFSTRSKALETKSMF